MATDQFRQEKGAVASRFCGNCHEPLLVASGAMDQPGVLSRGTRAAQAGVTCLICHSVTHVDREGNGRYLADLRPVPIGAGGVHGARVRPPLMNQAIFCAACHKVGLGADVTADRWLRGQDDYDAWHVSAVAGNGAGSVYRPAASQTCQDCHMPLEPATEGDAAAKNGMIRSHRFLGANTALPHLRGDAEQEERVARNLRGRASLALIWSGPRRVDALLRARGVGHRFPGGTMDSNEVWLEVTAFDAARPRDRPAPARAAATARSTPTRTWCARSRSTATAARCCAAIRSTCAASPSTPRWRRRIRRSCASRCRSGRRASRRGSTIASSRPPTRGWPAPICRRACGGAAWTCRWSRSPPPASPRARRRPAIRRCCSTGAWRWPMRPPTTPTRRARRSRRRAPPGRRASSRCWASARLAVRQGRTDDVLALAQQALARAPDHPAPLWLAARALTDAYRFAPGAVVRGAAGAAVARRPRRARRCWRARAV